jgi:hypothetical protein
MLPITPVLVEHMDGKIGIKNKRKFEIKPTNNSINI